MNYLEIELNSSVLVLNSDYNPINITNARRAIILLLKEKAHFISSKVIRLVNYVRLPFIKLMANKPTRTLIYKRDNHTCCYCGSTKNLTIDHILPTSRGGKNTWENLVASCMKCNSHKGDRTPEEWGRQLNKTPSAPYNKMVLTIKTSSVAEWKEYCF